MDMLHDLATSPEVQRALELPESQWTPLQESMASDLIHRVLGECDAKAVEAEASTLSHIGGRQAVLMACVRAVRRYSAPTMAVQVSQSPLVGDASLTTQIDPAPGEGEE